MNNLPTTGPAPGTSSLEKAPDWLGRREGHLRLSQDRQSLSVYFAGALQYLLVTVPVRGNYGCRITETINGRRLDGQAVYQSPTEALLGGLQELRQKLGW